MAIDIFEQLLNKEFGNKIKKEYRFAPPHRWRFDYAFADLKIAIEIDGGVFTNGRHVRGAGFKKDMEKFNAAAVRGWLVLKFTPQERYLTSTLETISETINYRKKEAP